MKIETKVGNLLDVKYGHIVHGCNAQGVMGSCVALAVKRMYPRCYEYYREEYEKFGLQLGYSYPYVVTPDLIVWNAITQDGYGAPTRNCSYDAIQSCFELINNRIKTDLQTYAKQIHIPAIGAGLGGGNWEIIREIIEQTVEFPTTLWVLPT